MQDITEADVAWIESHGLHLPEVEAQLALLRKRQQAPSFLRTASLEDGIQLYNEAEEAAFIAAWDAYLEKGKTVGYFIPASGSASRFFRDLTNFLKADYDEPQTNFEKNFFKHLSSFAFYSELNQFCVNKINQEVEELLEKKQYKKIISYLLTEEGLNYAAMPSSMFKFHTDKSKRFAAILKYLPRRIVKYYASFEDTRTPIQEILIESAMVSGTKGSTVNVCFTVKQEHRDLIEEYVREFVCPIEKKFGLSFFVTLPCQRACTDTIALNAEGMPLRDDEGRLVFLRSGHGALFENFCAQPSDIVFVKNVDNVAPDPLKKLTSYYKKMLAGVLLSYQKSINRYLRLLDKGNVPEDKLIEIINFVENKLNIKSNNVLSLQKDEQITYLHHKLNRPLRVCGMVKNEDEQGGMPCWVNNSDGTVSLQIVEYYQVFDYPDMLESFLKSTHFNPVDIVCSMTDYKGHRFDLSKYTDDSHVVCSKIWHDQNVRMLERPGLWNGCMDNWNTVFVEVPVKTFNPVKTVNDLLRHEHQNQ